MFGLTKLVKELVKLPIVLPTAILDGLEEAWNEVIDDRPTK